MKQLIIFTLLILLFTACSKEDDCKQCTLITESNYKEADNKCDGLANSYPKFDILKSESIGQVCGDNIQTTKNQLNKSETKTLCNGVSYTVRSVLQCN